VGRFERDFFGETAVD
jgi:hypothetical protein